MSRKRAALSSTSGRRARRRGSSTAALLLALAFALPLLGACGGESGGSGGGGLAFRAVWEQPPAPQGQEGCTTPEPTPLPSGLGPDIPAAVRVIQIVIRAAEGTDCCIRFDPVPERRSVAILNVPAGAATVTITGFPDEVYAAALSIPACQLDPSAPNPPSRACDGGRQGQPNPSFQSDATAVNVLSAGSTNAGSIPVHSLPFVILGDCPQEERFMEPPLDGEAGSTSVDFTVADARGEIDRDTVAAAFIQGGRQIETNVERLRCSDTEDEVECSCDRVLRVSGYRGVGGAQDGLQPGEAVMRISAQSCDGRSLSFEYPFTYVPASPTVTATETSAPPTPTPTAPPPPTDTSTPSPSTTATATSTPSRSATATETWTPSPTPTIPVILRIVGGPVTPGNVQRMSVSIEVPPPVEVAELEQSIGFDPDGIELFECIPNDALQERFSYDFVCNGTCILLVAISPDGPPIPTSTLYDCLGIAGPGIHPLTCEGEVVRDPQGTPVPATCIPGQIEVPTATATATPSPPATATDTQSPTPTPPVVLRILGEGVTPGVTPRLSVSIEVAPSVEVAQLEQRIGFNPNAFEFLDCILNDALLDHEIDPATEGACDDTCILRVTVFPNETPIPTGPLYDCFFAILNAPPDIYPLTCEDGTTVRNPQGTPVPVTCSPGQFEVP